MARIHPGRFTAEIDGEFVVFLIGMRFNRLWKVHRWLPVFRAMPRMLRELSMHPDLGLLGYRIAFGGRTITVVQYWRSYEQLEAFAKDRDATHLPAWRAYNAAIGKSGDVGVYHETYRIEAGAFECLYANMPAFGLAAARDGRHVPVGRHAETSRERIGATA